MIRSLGVFTAPLVSAALTPGAVRRANAEGTWADLTSRMSDDLKKSHARYFDPSAISASALKELAERLSPPLAS